MAATRDPLADWVYAERHLMTSFDAELLERHATAQLARALNTRRLLAVIGSGVSSGYGQPSWTDILRNSTELLDTLLAELTNGGDVLFGELKAIADTYWRLSSAWRTGSPKPDELPVAFEVCENLYAAIHVHRTEKSTGGTARRSEKKKALAAFRDRLKWQLRDERGRLELLLSRLANRADDGTKIDLRNIRDLIAYPLGSDVRRPDRTKRLRTERFVQHLYHAVPTDFGGSRLIADALGNIPDETPRAALARHLEGWIREGERSPRYSTPAGGTGVLVRPHLLEAGLELLGPKRAVEVLAGIMKIVEGEGISATGEKTGEAVLDTLVRKGRVRRAMLPRHRDPVAVLLDELKVKRLLTTNYDGEIDRLLGARGYSPVTTGTQALNSNRGSDEEPRGAAPSRTILMDASFGRAEILAYEPGAAAYLFDYGADTREQGVKVLHLHGRAKSESSWLVLSERDYRERYARDDDPSAQADDAMRLVFTANPLLFLGLGMQEPDILRPLRAFSEDVSRLCDRPAIALLPRDGEVDKRQMLTAATLARYGVYTLHYGAATVGDKGSAPDFMAKLLDVQGAVDKRLDGKDPKSGFMSVAELEELPESLRLVEGGTTGLAPVLAVAAQLRALLEETDGPADETTIHALRSINRGIYGVVLTTFMTAWLQRMVESWRDWQEAWSSAPNPREPGGRPAAEIAVGDGFILEASRHRTLLRNLDHEMGGEAPSGATAPTTDRFFAGAPSPAFQVLRASMLEHRIARPEIGRRVIYLLSERGTGRGHVFSAMRSPRRFARLCDWMHITAPETTDKRGSGLSDVEALAHTRNVSRAFYNLGMSHEVISSFDRLARFLETFASQAGFVSVDEIEYFTANCGSLESDRIGRFKHVLKVLSRKPGAANETTEGERGRPPKGGVRRAVIVINHFDVLFDSQGNPKNAQVGKLFEILNDRKYEQAPLDFIFMVDERRLPRQLREAGQAKADPGALTGLEHSDKVAFLEPKTMSADERREIEHRRAVAFGADAWMARRKSDKENIRTYVHFLRWMRPVTLAARFFPRAAVALAHIGTVDRSRSNRTSLVVSFNDGKVDEANDAPCLGFSKPEDVRAFQHAVREAFEDALADDREGGSVEASERLGTSFGSDAIEDAMLEVLAPYLDQPAVPVDALERLDQAKQAVQKAVGKLASTPHQVPISRTDLSRKRQQHEHFGRVASAVGHSRYAMTLTLAVVDDMIARRMAGVPTNVVDLAAIDAFIDRLKLATAGRAPGVREGIAIAQALQLYQTDNVSSLGSSMNPWPMVPVRCTSGATWARLSNVDHAMLFSLQRSILVTLALIGQPVDASILTGVDSVAKWLQQLGQACGFDRSDKSSMRECLHAVLDLLVHRCLVFRIAPKGSETDAEAWHRFATHKSLRRHIFHEINAPGVDFSQVDQLTVSMYATQPSELPRPTAEGHRRVRRLIEQLSRYECREDQPAHRFDDPFLDGTADDRDRVARSRLRAAYGALRSIYSIAVVSRFSKYEDEGLDAPEAGFFENHRLRVRWMLRRANELDGRLGEKRAADDEVLTFHPEEIVWLFNECGVLSLVEGRINDAVALLTQARRTARDFVERSDWGPLIARISLNRAVANIMRGRPGEASELLDSILKEERDEHRGFLLVARGYQALVRDMRGDPEGAIDEYREIISKLVEMKRFRPAAIFAIHTSEAMRSLGTEHAGRAIEYAEAGGRYAVEGGHEDIRRIAQLTNVAAYISKVGGAADHTEARFIEKELADVLAYAKLMGMPRLSCSVGLARGEFFMNQGDYRMAAELAQNALGLATRHEIEISKISALRLLGVAMLRLERTAARTLLIRARELAYLAEFRSEVTKIEKALAEA